MKFLALLMLLVVAMGPGGLKALGDMTGLQVVSGTYDFQKDFTIIRATGKQWGDTWEIHGLWRFGVPVVIKTVRVGQAI